MPTISRSRQRKRSRSDTKKRKRRKLRRRRKRMLRRSRILRSRLKKRSRAMRTRQGKKLRESRKRLQLRREYSKRMLVKPLPLDRKPSMKPKRNESGTMLPWLPKRRSKRPKSRLLARNLFLLRVRAARRQPRPRLKQQKSEFWRPKRRPSSPKSANRRKLRRKSKRKKPRPRPRPSKLSKRRERRRRRSSKRKPWRLLKWPPSKKSSSKIKSLLIKPRPMLRLSRGEPLRFRSKRLPGGRKQPSRGQPIPRSCRHLMQQKAGLSRKSRRSQPLLQKPLL